MMRRLLILFLIPIAQLAIAQQSSFLPEKLAEAINSEYDELNPVLSPDGLTLYFVRSNHPENKYGEFDSQDIWFSEFHEGGWTPAKRLPELNIGRYSAVLSAFDDGKTLLLNGVYNKNGTLWKRRGLSTSTLRGDGRWGAPVRLRIKRLKKINDGLTSNASMNDDGSILVMSLHRFYNSKRADIFYSTKKSNGKWTKPKKVHALSSRGTEASPFLSADGKKIFLVSDGAQKGQFEVYTSTRPNDNWWDWSTPAKMSDTVNTNFMESFFKTNKSGSWAYFSSSRGAKDLDIYRVKLFEEFPYVVVSGLVKNGVTGKTIQKPFEIKVNGIEPDSLVFNTDSSTYRLVLPLRAKYKLQANVPQYTSKPVSLDVSSVREFTRKTQDLVVNPLPYIQLSGRVLDRATNLPISASANPKVFLDGLEPDSLQFDSRTGTYTIKLLHGKLYSMQVRAARYSSQPSTLDLTSVNEYQEITLNLFAETEKLVRITGLVTDKKSNTRFTPASKVQVVFAGPATVAAQIDTITSQFELYLQPGGTYSITATAPDCLPTYETLDLSSAARGSTISKNLTIGKVEVGEAVRLNNIFFESGKAALKKESFPELDKVFDFLSQNPTIRIEIDGHTDNLGNAAFNLSLSASRAKAVADYLAKKGIAKARLESKGFGSTKPLTSNAYNAGRAQNRRVEFVILGK